VLVNTMPPIFFLKRVARQWKPQGRFDRSAWMSALWWSGRDVSGILYPWLYSRDEDGAMSWFCSEKRFMEPKGVSA